MLIQIAPASICEAVLKNILNIALEIIRRIIQKRPHLRGLIPYADIGRNIRSNYDFNFSGLLILIDATSPQSSHTV